MEEPHISTAPDFPQQKPSQSITLKLDFRLLCVLLVIVIAVMLGLWRPWENKPTTATRKITVTGTATVESTPDEFDFNPSFERTGTDTTAMKNDLNTFGTKLVADMKKLGIPDKDVTIASNSYEGYVFSNDSKTDQTLTMYVTIKASNKELAQKVQDYLAQTDAKGELTGQPQFSTSKQKSLEGQARIKAIADASDKAKQSASHLDAKLGKVLEVKDDDGYSSPRYTVNSDLMQGANSADATASLPVTAGSNEVSSSVVVTFAID
jgi:uncharacterized protein YggE